MKTLNLRKETVQTAALPTLGFNGGIASILICRFHGTVGTEQQFFFWMAVLWQMLYQQLLHSHFPYKNVSSLLTIMVEHIGSTQSHTHGINMKGLLCKLLLLQLFHSILLQTSPFFLNIFHLLKIIFWHIWYFNRYITVPKLQVH